ncbi:MAG: glycosyltransferase family 39 protein, partial [Planctomycetota bacterium]
MSEPSRGRLGMPDPLLLGVLLLAFVLRVQGINDEGYWLDEVTSLHDAAKPVGAILHGKGQPGHPPLYYLLLKGWIALFGTSETAVRILSAVFGTAAVGATCALFRALHGRAVGLAASLLLALSFHHVVFSQEARNYALFGFLAVLSAHALWRALAEGGRRRWAIYVACALLMVYTHHQAYVVLFGAATGAILAALFGRMRKGALRGLALADLVVVLAAAPSVVLYLVGVGGTARGYYYWQDHVRWRDLVDAAVTWTPGSPLFAPGSSFYGPGAPEVAQQPWLPLALLL